MLTIVWPGEQAVETEGDVPCVLEVELGAGGDRVVEKVGLEADSWGVVSGEAQGGQFLSRGCDPEWPSGDQWVRPPLGRPMSWWKPPW